MKSTPEQLSRKRAIERRKAWRELRGPCGDASPAPWLSDLTLERLDAQPARCVTAAKVRAAVRLANAAPDLLAVLESVVADCSEAESSGNLQLFCERMQANATDAEAALAKAKGRA